MRPHMNLWGAERMMTAACSATFLVSLDTLFHPVQKSSACSRAVWQMQSHWHRGDRTHATLRYPSELVPAVAPAVKCPETSIWNPACYLGAKLASWREDMCTTTTKLCERRQYDTHTCPCPRKGRTTLCALLPIK
ncbi:uncharacterized protein LOC144132515 isoform X4 [Amblyomma americanum]